MGTEIVLNGIEGATGNLLVPPIPLDTFFQNLQTDAPSLPSANALLLHGINPATFSPGDLTPELKMKIDALAGSLAAKGSLLNAATSLEPGAAGSFDLFNVNYTDLATVGWAILFPIDTPQAIIDALAPLTQRRQQQAGSLFKSFKVDPTLNNPYTSFMTSQGLASTDMPLRPVANCQKLPFYVAIVGGPEKLSFEFQRQLMTSWAVGRIAFDEPEQYAQYAQSVVDYETASSSLNTKEVIFWSPQLPEGVDYRATYTSRNYLVSPLAQQAGPGADKPVAAKNGFSFRWLDGPTSKKENLLALFNGGAPPAFLFTASHGNGVQKGAANQKAMQGALICGDYDGLHPFVKASQMLAASDVTDDATVKGMIMFMFACFGGGTPATDYYPKEDDPQHPFAELADTPFVSSLPQRLLSHPNGSALAVIAHVERAWAYSIQDPATNLSEVTPFRECIDSILRGEPVGAGPSFQFWSVVCKLSVKTHPIEATPVAQQQAVHDETLRRDYWNYIILGDPAVRLRTDLPDTSWAQPGGDTPANG